MPRVLAKLRVRVCSEDPCVRSDSLILALPSFGINTFYLMPHQAGSYLWEGWPNNQRKMCYLL